MSKRTYVKLSHKAIDSIREKHPNAGFVFAYGQRTRTNSLMTRHKARNNKIQSIGRPMGGWMLSPQTESQNKKTDKQ